MWGELLFKVKMAKAKKSNSWVVSTNGENGKTSSKGFEEVNALTECKQFDPEKLQESQCHPDPDDPYVIGAMEMAEKYSTREKWIQS